MKTPDRKYSKKEAGTVMTESAVLFPVFILLIFSIIDFSLLFWSKYQVSDTAKRTARTAAVGPLAPDPYGVLGLQDQYSFLNGLATQRLVQAPGFSMMAFETEVNNDSFSQLVVMVRIRGTYRFSLLRLIGLNTINISETASSRWELQPEAT